MEAGVDTPPPTERGATGMPVDFSLGDGPLSSSSSSSSSSPPRIPKRLRQRLLLECKSPSTVEEIEAKLRHADLRRQQHYEKLSSKARPKPKSPSHSSSQEEDLGQRLEAKLLAAEQKRLSILANAQKRLAMLDEVRQVAKAVLERRKEKEREKLGKEVVTRAQQAEANRMLILKAYRQRRATLMERSSMSLVRKMTWENKYKERVHAAISQKRAAAETKRLGLLEAEIKRARARVLQARRVAMSVSQQRELERRKMRDKLEDRMQRAKRKRAEYLRQRGRPNIASRVNRIRMHKQADILSRKLARCWRRFLKLRRTTLSLTEAYNSLKINGKSVKSMPFEQFAVLIESSSTLQTVKALLDRFESRLKVTRVVAATSYPSNFENIDHLLKRVASPKRRSTPSSSARSRNASKVVVREAAKSVAKPSRYPVRVVLCAYMIVGHPDAVLSGQGEREIALAKTAKEFVNEFELLIKIILEGPIQSSDDESESSPKQWTFRSQLAAFDKAWCSYLNCFVAWKVKDARALEEDLVRAACHLELSMLQTCKLSVGGGDNALTHDMKAIQKQVTDDQKLLREKVQKLSGDAGIERMESFLSETRSKYFQSKENGSPLSSPVIQFISSPIPNSEGPSVSRSDIRSNEDKYFERPARVVRSLFREDPVVAKRNDLSESRTPDRQLRSVGDLTTENEILVNEFLHQQHPFSDSLGMAEEDQNTIKVKMRETMQKAFWDDVKESLKQKEPNYDRVVQLVREIQDELCNMAPVSWKQQITEAFDVDFLSQILKSGNMDMDYLGRILDFTLITLQKLSSPSKESELKTSYDSLLGELTEICHKEDKSKNPCEIALIRGLQFVLEQIQVLKQEISKARIGMMKPILTGPHGFDYLRKAFANRYGVPSDASTKLPKTMMWLSSVWLCKHQEWEEHKNLLSLSSVISEGSSQGCLPSTSLRTGGSIIRPANASQLTSTTARETTGNEQPECSGGELDIAIRLGLLKLVTGVSGVTQEVLPEMFNLNLLRIRAVQSEVQKLIVTTTCILVCRQILLSQGSSTMTTTDIETAISSCSKQLSHMLDRDENAGSEEITEIIAKFTGDGDAEVLQSRRVVVSRMIRKCLQAGDAVFEKVSRAVYLGARGVVLGGSGGSGRRLAEMALRQVGGAVLTERMVKAAEVLVQAATVTVNVHEAWYVNLVNLIDCEI